MPKTFRIPVPSDSPYLSTDIREGQLPAFLERAMRVAEEPQQQDMLLFSALTAASFALPHLKMLHGIDQHTYYPNLMTLIIAPPASGKGLMKHARTLLEPIHKSLKNKGKLAFIPANSSSTAFIDILNASGGQGFMMDTEMDILSKIWKKDYGDYSDLFRQAYEHETFSKARRVGVRTTKSVVINSPRLSVLLSGTPSQVKPLLGSGEDGLASRFLPYIISNVMPFDRKVLLNGDHYTESSAKAVFDELAQELFARWQWLSSQDHDCLWSLTDEQAEVLGDLLEDAENLAFEQIRNRETDATFTMPIAFKHSFNRMVVTIKRIGLILTALRLPLPNSSSSKSDAVRMNSRETVLPALPSVLYCSDDDFRTLVLFAEKLLRHAADLILMLPAEKNPLPLNRIERSSSAKAHDLLYKLPDRFSRAEAAAIGADLGLAARTVNKYLALILEEKKISRLSRGNYKKVL